MKPVQYKTISLECNSLPIILSCYFISVNMRRKMLDKTTASQYYRTKIKTNPMYKKTLDLFELIEIGNNQN